jgi:hypothetical protein
MASRGGCGSPRKVKGKYRYALWKEEVEAIGRVHATPAIAMAVDYTRKSARVPRVSASRSLGCIVREKERQTQTNNQNVSWVERQEQRTKEVNIHPSPCLLPSLENRHVVRAF